MQISDYSGDIFVLYKRPPILICSECQHHLAHTIGNDDGCHKYGHNVKVMSIKEDSCDVLEPLSQLVEK